MGEDGYVDEMREKRRETVFFSLRERGREMKAGQFLDIIILKKEVAHNIIQMSMYFDAVFCGESKSTEALHT